MLLNTETGQGIIGQVGDGAILALSATGAVQELGSTEEQSDPQMTYTINKADLSRHIVIRLIQPEDTFTAFYVMNDGLSSDLLFTPTAPDAWARNVEANIHVASSPGKATTEMLHWLSTYQVIGSDDDRTLVVLVQRERNYGASLDITEQSQSTE